MSRIYELYLCHHGILGMHWGVRRYQNADGSLTSAGQKRYNGNNSSNASKSENKAKLNKDTLKKVAIGAGITAAVALTAYGAYKYSDVLKRPDFSATTELGKRKLQESSDRMQRELADDYRKMMNEGKIKSFTVSNGNERISVSPGKETIESISSSKGKAEASSDRMLRELASDYQRMIDEGKIKSFTVSNGREKISALSEKELEKRQKRK